MSERPRFANTPQMEYATEAEVLEFANKVREAGGANPLGALLPGDAGKSEFCLIARALNFSCRVRIDQVRAVYTHNSEWDWVMEFDLNMPEETAQKIADAVGTPLRRIPNTLRYTPTFAIDLPRHIGNTAHAFDVGEGWTTKYEDEPVL